MSGLYANSHLPQSRIQFVKRSQHYFIPLLFESLILLAVDQSMTSSYLLPCSLLLSSHRALEPGTYIKRSTQTLASARSGHLYHSRSCNLSVYSQQNVDFRMSCGLTAIGVIWAVVSILGTAASCVGFFLPYWLEGTLGNTSHPVHFGVFRRCNYFMNNDVVLKCGHYTTFSDIPTMTWKICTVVIGLGCVTSLFVSFCGLLACCVRDFVTRRVGRVCGVLQFIAGMFIFVHLLV